MGYYTIIDNNYKHLLIFFGTKNDLCKKRNHTINRFGQQAVQPAAAQVRTPVPPFDCKAVLYQVALIEVILMLSIRYLL
jgi:hypothetical protein